MAKTYEAIASQTLGSTASAVTFSSIPSTYTDLRIVCLVRLGSASGSKIRFNSDSGTNYSATTVAGQDPSPTAVTSFRYSSATSIYNNLTWGDATAANQFTPYTFDVMSYANTNVFKTTLWGYGTGGGLQGSRSEVGRIVGLWRSTSAITSIEISVWNPTAYQIGSTFSLYGVKAA